MEQYYFILGAADPEMVKIEKTLRESNQVFAIATTNGARVNAGNAYNADPVNIPEGYIPVIIEAEPANIGEWNEFVRIDHHRHGDYGYDLGYERYFEASSLGQLYKLLNLKPTADVLTLAAMDHCFADALIGKCANVDGKEVLNLKIENICAGTGLSIADVESKINFWLQKMKNTNGVKIINGIEVVNLTEHNMGTGYSSELLCSQVAAILSGKAVLLKHQDSEYSPLKVTINGNNSPDTIKYFKDEFCRLNYFQNIYGVESRRYAGGYFSSNTIEPLNFTVTLNQIKVYTEIKPPSPKMS